MGNYSYHSNSTMNRAQRRKNKINTQKVSNTKQVSQDELERIIKREMNKLRHETYTETVKREMCQRLKDLMKEYERQKQPEAVKVYHIQEEQTKNTVAYRKLNNSSTTKTSTVNQNLRAKRVMETYKNQMNFREYEKQLEAAEKLNTVKTSTKKQAVKKKSWLDKIFAMFKTTQKKKVVTAKKTVVKPKVQSVQKRYTTAIQNGLEEACKKLEKERQKFNEYCAANPTFSSQRNGYKVRAEEYCR